MESHSHEKITHKHLNKSFQNYDNINRMNYLFELGKLTNKKYPLLSSFYSKNLKLISRKTQQRLDGSIKHHLCKACNANLHSHPHVKIKFKKNHISQSCPNCGNVKRFPCSRRKEELQEPLDSRIQEIYTDNGANQKPTGSSHAENQSNKESKNVIKTHSDKNQGNVESMETS